MNEQPTLLSNAKVQEIQNPELVMVTQWHQYTCEGTKSITIQWAE